MRKLFFCLIIVALPLLASAQSPGQTLQIQGLAIDPFLIETEVEPGQQVKHTITLSNTTNQPLTFSISVNDFVTNGNNGQPLFLDSDETSDPRYSLSSWITITKQPSFTLPAQGQTSVEFTIAPPADAEPGTHYGGILFGQQEPTITIPGSEVQYKVGAIILARLGKSQEKGQISEFFSQYRFYQKAPADLALTYHNFGNVHSKPKGDVIIRNIFGQQVGQVPVNRDALIVLPESERLFQIIWSPKFAFGRYSAEAIIYYGSPKLELRAVTYFWIMPVGLLVSVIVGLIIAVTVAYFAIKQYNRYIIKRSQE